MKRVYNIYEEKSELRRQLYILFVNGKTYVILKLTLLKNK